MTTDAVARTSRTYSAPPEWVFDAFLDTGMIGRFMFGPRVRSESIVSLQLHPEVGGKFRFRVKRDGAEIDHVGIYREIVRPHRLVFTWSIPPAPVDGSVVTLDIAATQDGCELQLAHQLAPEWTDYTDRIAASWALMLDKLAQAL